MLSPDTLKILQDRLSRLASTDDLRQLFADWSYEVDFGRDIFLKQATKADERAQESLFSEPEILARAGDFEIIYAQLKDWNKALGSERLVISRLLNDHPFALWIFSDESNTKWHFVNVKRSGKETEIAGNTKRRHVLRRISLARGRKVGRTICERLARLDVATIDPSLFGVSAFQIQAVHDAAFDVESVTAAFYKSYRVVLKGLQERLKSETKAKKDIVWAHAQALQTLNRLMFLRFLEHKETHGVHWLGDDPDFTLNLWKTYRNSGEKDRFYSHWLKPLFFEAFNNQFDAKEHSHLPATTRAALAKAPYLNGGLFKLNPLDREYSHRIADEFFVTLFDRFDGQEPGFFERYNFTISEDSPFDQEVAVDPEMIGHVYESLISLAELEGEETDEALGDARGDHGIFYTQRVEIDLMGRLTLCDYFFNHLSKNESAPKALRDVLLEWVFAYDAQEKSGADALINKHGLWQALDGLLRDLKVCDPACGSGAFLVGMLAIVDDLQARINDARGTMETPYDRCRRIIGDTLYGVDVMEWAVHVAELRMWLQLLIENDVHPEELNRHYPLLPNLSFKVRCGDSLVQELGGVSLNVSDISKALRPELSRIITKKRQYFQAQRDNKITPLEIENDEKSFFAAVLLEERDGIRKRLDIIEKDRVLPDLMGNLPDAKQQKAWDKEAAQLDARLEDIRQAGADLSQMTRPPFQWNLSFAEIFLGDKNKRGFDIVIGNPPYVRQEKIGPPLIRDATSEQRKKYKEALMKSVQEAWPKYFEGGKRKLNGKSDLYIYFYLHGLKVLNEGGAFAFITSNSWLDVGYGAQLQEWLLRFGRVRFIFDNEVKRSFKSADVNTAIAILGRGSSDESQNAKAIARFIMWRVPFEQASDALLWQEIESADERCIRAEFRLRPFTHSALKAEGADADKPEVYSGNKWGGKYLRAPEIYDVILEKGKDKLVRLGDVADVRFGIKTGANEFFYLSDEQAREWEIESKYLRPVIKSPREYYSISIAGSDMKMFWCRDEKTALRGTKALKYIEWGEKQGFPDVPSLRPRKNWFWLNGPEKPIMLWPSAFFERHIVYQCPKNYVADKVFYTVSGEFPVAVKAFLNSTIVSLAVEVEGYQLNHGGIFATTEWLNNLPVWQHEDVELSTAYEAITKRDISLCSVELKQEDRARLDWRVLQLLGFKNKSALNELYENVEKYVAGRIHKSGRSITLAGRGE